MSEQWPTCGKCGTRMMRIAEERMRDADFPPGGWWQCQNPSCLHREPLDAYPHGG